MRFLRKLARLLERARQWMTEGESLHDVLTRAERDAANLRDPREPRHRP